MTPSRTIERRFWKGKSGSYGINLPPDWAKRVFEDRERGSIRALELNDRILLFDPAFSRPRELGFHLGKYDFEYLRRFVETAYCRDYDRVWVYPGGSDKANFLEAVDKLTSKFIGVSRSWSRREELEITMSTKTEPLESVTDRIFGLYEVLALTNLESMTCDGSTADYTATHASQVKSIEDDVDKYSFLAKRTLNRVANKPELVEQVGLKQLANIIDYYAIQHVLERLADLQEETFRCIAESPPGSSNGPARQSFAELVRDTHEYVSKAYGAKRSPEQNVELMKNKLIRGEEISSRAASIKSSYLKNDASKMYDAVGKQLAQLGLASNLSEAWLSLAIRG